MLVRVALTSVGLALILPALATVFFLLNPGAAPRLTHTVIAAATPPRSAVTPQVDPATYTIKRALTVDHRLRHGDWLWDERGAPPGEVLITVDLKAQLMSVFRDGYELGVAVIEHGADDKPTPLGSFPILQKDAHHRSSLYVGPDGRPAAMNWALRLTGDGVFVHAAEVRRDWGSNGCVGIPDAFARRLFQTAAVGDLVVITNGRTLQVGEALTAR